MRCGPIPRVGHLGAGRKETTSGVTFEAIRAYLVKARPRIAWLENVTDIQQTSVDMNESDADYIRDSLTEQGFTVVLVVFSAREYGSAVERLRWWALVFDVHPQYAEQVAMNVRRMLAACKLPSYPVENFLLSDNLIEHACEPLASSESQSKRGKGDVNWKYIHESAYSEMEMQWPPTEFSDRMRCLGFKQREGEVIHFAHMKFPSSGSCHGDGKWEWFDTNHTFERNFRYPWTEEKPDPRNPWKSWVPTLTVASAIVGRKVGADGVEEFKKLHGLEAMRLMGWDLGHYRGGNPCNDGVTTPDLLCDLAGNAWSAFGFLPIAIAAFGAVPASAYRKGALPAPSAGLAEESDASASSDDGSA